MRCVVDILLLQLLVAQHHGPLVQRLLQKCRSIIGTSLAADKEPVLFQITGIVTDSLQAAVILTVDMQQREQLI